MLLEFLNKKDWILPGGYILKEESLDSAAHRVLFDRTGLRKVFLQQFGVFGEPRRSVESHYEGMLKSVDMDIEEKKWILQRFITVGYYSLLELVNIKPVLNYA